MESKKNNHKTDIDPKDLNRRELIQKYAAYTAPLVVAMLMPDKAYAHNSMVTYSSTTTCIADTNAHKMYMPGHCQARHGT